ncbi:MAG: CsbD family protein [Candidatus Methanoperedens sp.]|nr:CsbD family protein [Candidatus Methanoperedens sp.]
MKSSTKDEVKGKVRKIKGGIKETVGELSDNPRLEAEGKIEKNIGKAQEKVGQIKKVAED